MLVTERMQALGDHAKSSRQPPVKERKHAKADENAAKQDTVDETILENGGARDSAVAVIVDDVTPQIVFSESDNDAEIQARVSQEDADISGAKRAIIHEWENWSALHSDELDDPKVADYFFRHLKMKRPHLSTFGSQETWSIVRG